MLRTSAGSQKKGDLWRLDGPGGIDVGDFLIRELRLGD